MAPKQRVPASTGTDTGATAATPSPRKSPSNATAHDILTSTWTKYTHKTPQRTKLLDTFMAFLIAVGALQFLYVVVVGNFVRVASMSILCDVLLLDSSLTLCFFFCQF